MIEGLGFAMALQFKPDGKGGWLYRKDQTGAPLPASQAERDGYIRWFGWIVLGSLPLFMGLVFVFAAVANAYFPNPSDNQGAAVAVVGMIPVFAITYGYVKWFSHAPARAFADRAPVGEAQTRKQVFGRRLQRFSYVRLWGGVALFIVVGIASLRDYPDSWWLPFVLFLPIGIGFTWWKWSIDREAG